MDSLKKGTKKAKPLKKGEFKGDKDPRVITYKKMVLNGRCLMKTGSQKGEKSRKREF